MSDFLDFRSASLKDLAQGLQGLHLGPNGLKAIILLEAHAWFTACTSGTFYGIPSWRYSNGTTLFETDKEDQHKKEHLQSYLDACEVLKVLLRCTETRTHLLDNPETFATLDTSIDPRPTSAYKEWQTKYLESIKIARKVLDETAASDSTDAFIQCKKCGSNAVDTEQKQTRSADEPMTIFCQCRKCKTCFRID